MWFNKEAVEGYWSQQRAKYASKYERVERFYGKAEIESKIQFLAIDI